jgi:hypothetical protein
MLLVSVLTAAEVETLDADSRAAIKSVGQAEVAAAKRLLDG